MKAIGYHTYGSPDVLELQEVAKPVPKEHEILIHVHAAAITPTDIVFRNGVPFLVRVFTGLRRPKKIPGTEFAGDIEAVGTAVTRFQKSDQVFGIAGTGLGAHAEYLDALRAPCSYQPRERFTMRTTSSITGTSISTPTTVANAAPE